MSDAALLDLRGFDLLAQALIIKVDDRVVGVVDGAAKGVRGGKDAQSCIDRAEHKNADICLASGNNYGIAAPCKEQWQKVGAGHGWL